MARTNGVLGDWTFDTLAWSARTLGGIGPLRRNLADRAEKRLRDKGNRPVPRHPPAVEQDKASFEPRPPPHGRARAGRAAGGAAGAARPPEDGSLRRPRAPRRREREGPLPGPAPGRHAPGLPGHQPGQGLQPRLRGLLRELGHPRREARLGHRRPHRARGPRRVGQPLLRAHGRRAPRLARGPEGRPRAGRGAPRLLLHHVLERDPRRRRGGPAHGRARQPQPGPLDRGDEGPHRRAAGRGRLRPDRGRRREAGAGGRPLRDLAHRHAAERGRGPERRGPRPLRGPPGRALRVRLPLHADRARVDARPHDDGGAALPALRAHVVARSATATSSRWTSGTGPPARTAAWPPAAPAATSTSTGTATSAPASSSPTRR